MKIKAKSTTPPCPCGRSLLYEHCCGVWHRLFEQSRSQPVDGDAEGLMRSRYTAYVLGLEPYLLATWAPQTRPGSATIDDPGIKWLGLRVVGSETTPDQLHASVEFIARSRHKGKGQRHHEISRFEQIDGHWFYVDGELQ